MITPGSAQQQNRETDNVSFTVRIDGKEVNMDPGGLISISVGLELNKIPWARIIFADGSVEKQGFEKADKDVFSPGKQVEILLGYSQKTESVFKGIIIKQNVRIQSGRNYKMEIECRDPAVRMTLVKRSRYFDDKTDTDIIKAIIKDHSGLKPGSLDDSKVKHKELVQFNVTDWDFMLLRADANGMYITSSNGSINMTTPSLKSKADLQVQFGQGSEGISLLEFEGEIDARNHYPGVNADSWDPSQQKGLNKAAGKVSGNAASALGSIASALDGSGAKKDFPDLFYKDQTVELYHGGDIDAQEIENWAKAKLKRGELSRVRGRAAVCGTKAIPGDTLKVNAVSRRYNGMHLITGVLHQFMKGHWKTDIQFGWERELVAESSNVDSPGLVAGIKGLQIGVVTAIKGNPGAGSGYIQVRIPFVAKNPNGAESKGIWARLATIYAGKDRGFLMRPETGDEVIVGFINDDPNDAIILGAVHSSKNTAPAAITVDDKNPVKGFVAKDGMKLLFDDDKHKIQLSTDDSGPRIEIDKDGKKINIVVDSTNSIEISSQGVKVSGTKIDLN